MKYLFSLILLVGSIYLIANNNGWGVLGLIFAYAAFEDTVK